MKSALLLYFSFMLLTACSQDSSDANDAQQSSVSAPGVISGRLYDRLAEGSPPVSGASLFTSPSTVKVFSNLDGTFQIVDPTPRNEITSYDLFVEKAGYLPVQQRVVVPAGAGASLDIPMSPEGVEIVATPGEIAISFERNVGFFHIHGNRSEVNFNICLLYTSPSPRDKRQSRMPSSA